MNPPLLFLDRDEPPNDYAAKLEQVTVPSPAPTANTAVRTSNTSPPLLRGRDCLHRFHPHTGLREAGFRALAGFARSPHASGATGWSRFRPSGSYTLGSGPRQGPHSPSAVPGPRRTSAYTRTRTPP